MHMPNKTIHIVHDRDGKIIAASESKNPPRPRHMPGVKVVEFEVPTKFVGKKMQEYIPLLTVDIKGGRLKEK
jgi:hypothetical protein